MTDVPASRQGHWQKVYETKAVDSVSWYRPHLEVSLELLAMAGMSRDSRIIDIGAGASTLVDDLLGRGLHDVSILDVSEQALAITKARLGNSAKSVRFHVVDVLEAQLPSGGFDFWHDRAVLHFLTSPADTARYAELAAQAVCVDGHAVIGGFAPDGPERCSGLPVARRSAEDIAAILAPSFSLVAKRSERHLTPSGADQPFAYALLVRK